MTNVKERAGIFRDKFCRNTDFENEEKKRALFYFLQTTIEQAVCEFIAAAAPVSISYKYDVEKEKEGVQKLLFEFFANYGATKRSFCIAVKIITTLDNYIFELSGKKNKTKQLQFPRGNADIESNPDQAMIDDLSIVVADIANDLVL